MESDNPEVVTSRDALAAFLLRLAEDLQAEDAGTAVSRSEFVESAGGWVQDMQGYFDNRGMSVPDEPTWELVATIFAAARFYE